MNETGRPPKNRTHIEGILADRLLLGSELISELVAVAGISRPAASRALERASQGGQVFSSAPVSFGEGRDHLYWMPEMTGRAQYFAEIHERLKQRPAFDCVVQTLMHGSGLLPERYLARFTPAPLDVRFGKPTVAKIFWDLKHLKVVKEEESERYGRSIAFTDEFREAFTPEVPSIPFHVRLRTEGFLLKVIAQWLQYTSMAAWNSVEVRNSFTGNPVVFNGFAFDLKAPTFLRPLARQAKKPVPGFLVADVTLSGFLKHEAKAFVRKLSFIRSRKNPPPVLAICFAESFHPSAFKILRETGVMAVQLSRLGSRGLPELVRSLANIFENVQSQEPHNLDKALKAVGQLAGERETNMAGSIFELMVGRFLEQQGYTVRFFGKKVRGELARGKASEREVDVVADRGEVFHIAEVKGYHRFQPVELGEVQRFIEETAPLARAALHVAHMHSVTTYGFYTASYFKKDARAFLESQREKLRDSKKLRIEFMDGKELKSKWEEEGLNDLTRLLERFFGTQRKVIYDPEHESLTDAPAPEFEQFISTAPEPSEIESNVEPLTPPGQTSFRPKRVVSDSGQSARDLPF